MVSESIYVEKGVWGANNIWKYQIKWNHFHHMGPDIIFSTPVEPCYFFLAYQKPKYFF